jgi:four helix bundle protein
MAKSLDELDVWQLANELRLHVLVLVRREVVQRDFRFTSQIQDCAGSLCRNIAEGYGRVRPREFAQFLFIARGSLFELRDQLSDGVLRGYWREGELHEARVLSRRTTGALNGFIRYLRSTKAEQAAAQWASQLGKNRDVVP